MTSESAIPKLYSINDLKQIDFGDSVPTHSLVLLHWFANRIKIENNDIICPTFNPNGDYCAHHYGNYDDPPLLPELPPGYIKYYTLGKMSPESNPNSTMVLPSYVTKHHSNVQAKNRDRILFRVKQENAIDQVYITQHSMNWKQGSGYDPKHTYQITTNLLREIRKFSEANPSWDLLVKLRDIFGSEIDDNQLCDLKNEGGDHDGCELLLYIVCKTSHMTLKVKTGDRGKAMIHWSNIPQHLLEAGVMVVLFKNTEGESSKIHHSIIIDRQSGSYDTTVPLNTGLQVRLHKAKRSYLFWTKVGEEICRGQEFHNHESQMTISIRGYDAKLQLFVKDGKACARLYVGKTFTDWRSQLSHCWIGFYSSAMKDTKHYETWQWATKFTKCAKKDVKFDTYEYHSSMAIAPGAQARFIFRGYADIICTNTWPL